MELNNKKVLVVGAGQSGIAAARLLLSAGALVYIRDGSDKITVDTINEKLKKEWEITKDTSHSRNISGYYLGDVDCPESDIEKLDLIVVSPGVPLEGAFIDPYIKSKVPIWGEVELAYAFEKGKVLAITGTNGKTTTTALLGKIMEDYLGSDRAVVVGNIGDPYTREVGRTKEDSFTVAEISSFMLETTHEFAPLVAAVLNVTPDHLNRHHTMEEYSRVKECIAKKLPDNGYIVLNALDERCRDMGERAGGKALYFAADKREAERNGINPDIYYEDGGIYTENDRGSTLLIREEEARIVGLHNMENIMAAALMAIKAGVSRDSLIRSIRDFKAVEHRIEYVAEIDDVLYYNDSKGTNPDAAIKGICAMSRPAVLIAGGYDKGSDYADWIKCCVGRVKSLVLIGATAPKIRDCAVEHGITNIFMENSFEEAMERCFAEAKPGDCVLLSPACASWGMFSNFEERGRLFKELVIAHKGSGK